MEAGIEAMQDGIAQFHIRETKRTEISAKMEEISLVQRQIEVLKEHRENALMKPKKKNTERG